VYGVITGLIGLIAVGGRIIGEEEMLTNELVGYEDYLKKVTYRLIPFIWRRFNIWLPTLPAPLAT
jgi:protein-S-isoprenylcysteine O-methyltransferase Ste14